MSILGDFKWNFYKRNKLEPSKLPHSRLTYDVYMVKIPITAEVRDGYLIFKNLYDLYQFQEDLDCGHYWSEERWND